MGIHQNAPMGIAKELGPTFEQATECENMWIPQEKEKSKSDPRHSQAEAIVWHNMLILATCCDYLMIRFLCLSSLPQMGDLSAKHWVLCSMRDSMTNCIHPHVSGFHMLSRWTESKNRVWAPLFLWENRQEEFIQLLVLLPVCLTLFIHPYFS